MAAGFDMTAGEKKMAWKKIALFLCLLLALAGCSAKAPPPQSPRDATAATADGPAKFAAEDSSGSFGAPATQAEPGSFDQAPAAPPPRAPAPPRNSTAKPSAPSGGSGASASRTEPKADAAQRTPAPEQRPGLGTEWGETRVSKVHDVTFVRDSSRPFAIAMMNYNDRKGVDALVAAQGSRRDSFRSIPTTGGAVNIAIRDANGEALEAVRVGDRMFVIGQAGQRYTIVLTNKTSHRFEAVTTVDGLDVVNGKDGSFDNRGYVLMPFATLEIEGFRQSANAVAAFRFASVAESYATAMGKSRNIGVIGVALFSERGDSFVPESETRMRDTASPFPADPRFAPPPPNR